MEYTQAELKTFLKNKERKISGPKKVLCQRLLDASRSSQRQFFPGLVSSALNEHPVRPSNVLHSISSSSSSSSSSGSSLSSLSSLSRSGRDLEIDLEDTYTIPKDQSDTVTEAVARAEAITSNGIINDLTEELARDQAEEQAKARVDDLSEDPMEDLTNDLTLNLAREVSRAMSRDTSRASEVSRASRASEVSRAPKQQPFSLSDEDFAAMFNNKFTSQEGDDAQARTISQHRKQTQDRLMKSKAIKPTFLKINETPIKDLEEVLQNLSNPLTVKGSDLKLISQTVERALGLIN